MPEQSCTRIEYGSDYTDVRFGSLADIGVGLSDVRFTPETGHAQFAKRGIKYEPSKDPKGTLYLNLLPMLNSGKVRLLGNKRLVSQLVGLERNTARGGKDNIDHARGGHDDVANAVAGAMLSATAKPSALRQGTYGYGGPVTWLDKPPKRLRDKIRVVHVDEQGREV